MRCIIIAHTMSRWTDEQDTELRKLVSKNIITYTNLEPNYLFEVTQEHFPDFVGTGPSARKTAIQCLRKKFRQIAETFEINGGRLLTGESFVSFVHAFYNKLLMCLVFQTRTSTKTEKRGPKKGGNRLTLTKQTKNWQRKKPLQHLAPRQARLLLLHPKRHRPLPVSRRT